MDFFELSLRDLLVYQPKPAHGPNINIIILQVFNQYYTIRSDQLYFQRMGGRAFYQFIMENSGFLCNVCAGNVILEDRGF